MRNLLAIAMLALALGGCAGLQKLQQVYTLATTTTVDPSIVRPAANAFDILKGTAANFARYCVNSNNTAAGCDVTTRQNISTFVRQGTQARIQMRAALATNQPVLSTVYNILVNAVNGLNATPVATFTGG